MLGIIRKEIEKKRDCIKPYSLCSFLKRVVQNRENSDKGNKQCALVSSHK